MVTDMISDNAIILFVGNFGTFYRHYILLYKRNKDDLVNGILIMQEGRNILTADLTCFFSS
jgi:hypothetical protein